MDKPSAFRIGERVQLHPATDLWMRGARFGTVEAIGRELVHVRLDTNNTVASMHPDNVLHVEG